MIREFRPLYEERHPAAEAVARELVSAPALLQLRTRRLVPDIVAARQVSETTARRAVALARKQVAA